MAQAKGVLPTRGEDREVLYKNPRMCGYFFGVQLKPDLNGEQVRQWIGAPPATIDALVARIPDPQAGVADVRRGASGSPLAFNE